MKMFIGDRILNMSEEELDSLYLQEGTQVTAYKVNGEVYKLFHNGPLISKLSKDEIERLRRIKCKRFIMPNEAIMSSDSTVLGYTVSYLDLDNFELIYSMTGANFKNEVSCLLDDIETLSKEKIEIDDLHLDNIAISKDKLYFIDPGSFFVSREEDYRSVYDINKYRFDNFIVNNLMAARIAKKDRKKLEKVFSNYGSLEEFLKEMNDDENIKDFAKRMVK